MLVLKNYNEEQHFDKIRNDMEKYFKTVATTTLFKLRKHLDVSDIVAYKVAEKAGFLPKIVVTGKNFYAKKEMIEYILENPYKNTAYDLARIYSYSAGQVVIYAKAEEIEEYVPTKYYKIYYRLKDFLEKHEGEYSRYEVIAELELNIRTFYKILAEFPELEDMFRKMSLTQYNIKKYLDNMKKPKTTYREISKDLNVQITIVKTYVEGLGQEYVDKIEIIETSTDRVIKLVKDNPYKYEVNTIAEELKIPYNTAHKIVYRKNLQSLLSKF